MQRIVKNRINYGTRARIGVVLPSGNRAAEPQFSAMVPEGVSLHWTRLGLVGTTEADLLAMVSDVESAARLLKDVDPQLLLFHCTAVSTYSVALEAEVVSRLESTSGCKVVATSQAITSALRALGVSRLVMISPYPEHINLRESGFLRDAGFDIVGLKSIECANVEEMMAISSERWQSFAEDSRIEEADGYLLSCTAVQTAEVVEALEASLGKPVITSNTAALWHCLRTLDVNDPIYGYGRLLSAK
ncbi:hypothetical protein PuT2_14605 [Pusillimonas sp. T2]|nr:hypothetical protein PuT2_14605 [Pusillimonas sp. T2]